MAESDTLGKKKAPPRRGKKEPLSIEASAAIKEIDNPPPVEPPHQRGKQAHDLLLEAKDWETVRTEAGFETIAETTLAVQAYLSYVHVMTGDDERQMAKRVELARLDALWREWYPLGSRMKDKDAAMVLLHISKARIQLQELDHLDQRAGSSQTIVITRMPGAMARQLEQAALAQEAAKQLERNRQRQEVIDVEAQDVVDAVVVSN